MSRPIVVDIDGTMSRPDRSIEGRVLDALRAWDDLVVVATGKAFPYPVALCDFAGIPIRVIAENGGVVATDDAVQIHGRPRALDAFIDAFRDAGYDLGWGEADYANRWRETEIATTREAPLDLVRELAAEYGLTVVDSEYAYHVKARDVDKGAALVSIAELLGVEPTAFAAIGDSPNDVATFEAAGVAYAVANATTDAKAAADHVTASAYADGLFEALEAL